MSLNGTTTPTLVDALTVRQQRAVSSLRSTHAALDVAREKRAKAVTRARDAGVPWKLIADVLDMTPEGAAKLMQRGR